jgi:hypothetical protein
MIAATYNMMLDAGFWILVVASIQQPVSLRLKQSITIFPMQAFGRNQKGIEKMAFIH